MGRKKTKSKLSENRQRYYSFYRNHLLKLAITTFKWEGLPDNISERFIELKLATTGQLVMFKEPVLEKLVVTPVNLTGIYDYNEMPKTYVAHALNGYTTTLDETNSVLLFNDYLHENTIYNIDMFATKLADIEVSKDINLSQLKTPAIIKCEDRAETSFRNMFRQWQGDELLIVADKDIDTVGSIDILKLDVPFLVDKYRTELNKILNDAYTYLGIENSNTEKKERLVESETEGNNGSIEINRFIRLTPRIEFCEKAKELFDVDVSVSIRSNLDTSINEQNVDDESIEEGGEELNE